MSKAFVPEIWSKELMKRFHDTLTVQDVINQSQVVLTLGPNIGLTLAQIEGAIADPTTDPIIRDALMAYKAKHRILNNLSPPRTGKMGTIYGMSVVEHTMTGRIKGGK